MNNITGDFPVTLVGVLLAALLAIQSFSDNGAINFSDPQLWIAAAVAALGALTKRK